MDTSTTLNATLAPDVNVVVPSYERAGEVRLLRRCDPEARRLFRLAVPAAQLAAYQRAAEKDPGQRPGGWIPVPDHVRGIAATRQWLTDNSLHRILIQVSDDVRFFERVVVPSGKPPIKFAEMGAVALCILFNTMAEHAAATGHAGLSPRATIPKDEWLWGSGWEDAGQRMCDVYAHDVQLLGELGVRWDRVPVMEDFDVTLQLLRRGLPNTVLYRWCWDQPGSNLPGGCSLYRSPQVQQQGAETLHQLHPDFVTVVQKEAKNWQGFNTRYDVRVAWKRALAAADLAKTSPAP